MVSTAQLCREAGYSRGAHLRERGESEVGKLDLAREDACEDCCDALKVSFQQPGLGRDAAAAH